MLEKVIYQSVPNTLANWQTYREAEQLIWKEINIYIITITFKFYYIICTVLINVMVMLRFYDFFRQLYFHFLKITRPSILSQTGTFACRLVPAVVALWLLSYVQLFEPMDCSLSMGFPRQEYWRKSPIFSPGDPS